MQNTVTHSLKPNAPNKDISVGGSSGVARISEWVIWRGSGGHWRPGGQIPQAPAAGGSWGKLSDFSNFSTKITGTLFYAYSAKIVILK